MKREEYAAYEATVADFISREGILGLGASHPYCPECHSSFTDSGYCPKGHGHRELFDEPYFSWSPCECCGSSLGGNRQKAFGFHPKNSGIFEYSICENCVYYAEYGRLDDGD